MKDDILLGLYNYCHQKYNKTEMTQFINSLEDEFPYHIEGMDTNNLIRSFMDWFVLEKIIPQTGKRLTESYVEEHPELDEETKQKILNTKNIIISEFIVIAKDGLNLKLKDRKNGSYYSVVQISNNPQIQANTMILGRIFPWGQIYRFAGVMALAHTPMILDPEIMMHHYEKKEIERTESIILSPSTKLTAVLNKYPFQWVDGMCSILSLGTGGRKNDKARDIAEKIVTDLSVIIDKLPDRSKEALKFILNNGGFVKYGLLKDYDNEISWWWNNHPPKSTIGLLRLYGLVVVGKMPQGTKLYKTALIPKELQEKLKEIML
ncbi:TPA: hypothetical protein HA242_01390 [Candidatus Woesearchaeota archaeon]|nr:hypothetical protein [Candidatus Woesearchaeota archaeon]HIG93411.1 hypothetical protein [Candidatus Woesearchaeota archaeon]HIH12352.1 hypothetical protein [Candidatus Woesearchaeota archaeon]